MADPGELVMTAEDLQMLGIKLAFMGGIGLLITLALIAMGRSDMDWPDDDDDDLRFL